MVLLRFWHGLVGRHQPDPYFSRADQRGGTAIAATLLIGDVGAALALARWAGWL